MSCYRYKMSGETVGFICGDLGPHCADCGTVSDSLCDFPVGKGKTCDRAICDSCSPEIAPDLHYCKPHQDQWEAFKDSGGVKAELEKVVPFKRS